MKFSIGDIYQLLSSLEEPHTLFGELESDTVERFESVWCELPIEQQDLLFNALGEGALDSLDERYVFGSDELEVFRGIINSEYNVPSKQQIMDLYLEENNRVISTELSNTSFIGEMMPKSLDYHFSHVNEGVIGCICRNGEYFVAPAMDITERIVSGSVEGDYGSAIALSDDVFAIGTYRGLVSIMDSRGARKESAECGERISGLQWIDDHLISTSYAGELSIHDSNMDTIHTQRYISPITCLRSKSTLACVGTQVGAVDLWDMRSGQLVMHSAMGCRFISDVDISHHFVAASSMGGDVYVFDIRMPSRSRSACLWEISVCSEPLLSLSFTESGCNLVCSGFSPNVYVIDSLLGQTKHTLQHSASKCFDHKVCDSGLFLACNDKSIKYYSF
ncbi:hypothetical protein PCE1_000456 [Barthelona sp. PCE]